MNISTKSAMICIAISTGLFAQVNALAPNAKNATVEASYVQTAPMKPVAPLIGTYTPNKAATEAIATLTYNQKAWFKKMIGCESSGNPKALNPKDRDNTPSYGLLEYKPATFYAYAKLYKIKVTDVKNPDEQVQITVEMVHHREQIDWFNTFPDCVRKHGQPPAN